MNNRERILAALAHQQPDRVPYHIEFTQHAHAKMVEYYQDPDFASRLGNCFTVLGCAPAGSSRQVRRDVWEDQFGIQWDRSIDKDIGVVCNRAATLENFHDYTFPDPDDPSRYADYAQTISEKRDRFVVVNLGFSLFERAWTLVGMENLLMGMVANKTAVHQLLDEILAFNLRVIENVCAYDVDAMMFGDDWGMQTGLLMGPKLWREFIKPRIKQMYDRVKSRDKFVFIHSCGKVDELFPDLIECGLDVFNPFQPEVMDVFEMKRRFGDQLTFYGGISTQKTLPHATVDQVKGSVRRLLEVVGQDGGYISAPAHDIPADAKPENIAAMIEVLQNQ